MNISPTFCHLPGMTSKTNFPASSGFVAISLIVLPGRYMQPWKIESEAFKRNINVISFKLNLSWRTGRTVLGWWRRTWKRASQLWMGPFSCSDLGQIKWQLCEHREVPEETKRTRSWPENELRGCCQQPVSLPTFPRAQIHGQTRHLISVEAMLRLGGSYHLPGRQRGPWGLKRGH